MRFLLPLLALSTPVQAAPFVETYLSDKNVAALVHVALENIHRARCGEGFCKPATAEEHRELPVALSEARLVQMRGFFSGVGKACGLDWQSQNFRPMMRFFREGRKSERQMALIDVMHGIAQQSAAKPLAGGCPADMRGRLPSLLPFPEDARVRALQMKPLR